MVLESGESAPLKRDDLETIDNYTTYLDNDPLALIKWARDSDKADTQPREPPKQEIRQAHSRHTYQIVENRA